MVNQRDHRDFILAAKNAVFQVYSRRISPGERRIIEKPGLLSSLTSHLPDRVVMPVYSVLEPIYDDLEFFTIDSANFIYRACRVKRNIDYTLQEQLTSYYEYQCDMLCQDETCFGDEHRGKIANLQQHCIHVELSICRAITDITMRGFYVNDLVFPYNLVALIDRDTGLFEKIKEITD